MNIVSLRAKDNYRHELMNCLRGACAGSRTGRTGSKEHHRTGSATILKYKNEAAHCMRLLRRLLQWCRQKRLMPGILWAYCGYHHNDDCRYSGCGDIVSS